MSWSVPRRLLVDLNFSLSQLLPPSPLLPLLFSHPYPTPQPLSLPPPQAEVTGNAGFVVSKKSMHQLASQPVPRLVKKKQGDHLRQLLALCLDPAGGPSGPSLVAATAKGRPHLVARIDELQNELALRRRQLYLVNRVAARHSLMPAEQLIQAAHQLRVVTGKADVTAALPARAKSLKATAPAPEDDAEEDSAPQASQHARGPHAPTHVGEDDRDKPAPTVAERSAAPKRSQVPPPKGNGEAKDVKLNHRPLPPHEAAPLPPSGGRRAPPLQTKTKSAAVDEGPAVPLSAGQPGGILKESPVRNNPDGAPEEVGIPTQLNLVANCDAAEQPLPQGEHPQYSTQTPSRLASEGSTAATRKTGRSRGDSNVSFADQPKPYELEGRTATRFPRLGNGLGHSFGVSTDSDWGDLADDYEARDSDYDDDEDEDMEEDDAAGNGDPSLETGAAYDQGPPTWANLPAPAANIFVQVTPDDETEADTAEGGDEVGEHEEDEDSTGEMQNIWGASNQNGQAATVTHSLTELASALREGLDVFYRERTPVPPSKDVHDRDGYEDSRRLSLGQSSTPSESAV